MTAAEELAPFIGALNLTRLRIGPPRRFIFFCGGTTNPDAAKPPSLRDYLLRKFQGRAAIAEASFVLAESATTLYRDSNYRDLIKFEEDIAQISEMVLLIGESPGSLTELGAFAMNLAIAPRLKIIVREDHYNHESFIRFGPLRHMEQDFPDSVSTYPWRVNRDGTIIKTSVDPHLPSIKQDIQDKLAGLFSKEALDTTNARHIMILIFWIIYVLRGATLKDIVDSLQLFNVLDNQDRVRKYLYCMRLANWISDKKYGHPIYYYNLIDIDPFEYAFVEAAKFRDAVRWKSDLAERLRRADLTRPKPVLELIGK